MTTIQVFTRNVYGRPTIYPANQAGLLLAQLINKKTFDKRDIGLAKQLGMVVEQVADPAMKGVL